MLLLGLTCVRCPDHRRLQRPQLCVQLVQEGPPAVPARCQLPAEGHRRVPDVQEDVVLAQSTRQELQPHRLPCAAVPRAQGCQAQASSPANSLENFMGISCVSKRCWRE